MFPQADVNLETRDVYWFNGRAIFKNNLRDIVNYTKTEHGYPFLVEKSINARTYIVINDDYDMVEFLLKI
jgi:hypothetical protein